MGDLAVRQEEASLPCSLRNARQPAAVVRVSDHHGSEHGIGVTKVPRAAVAISCATLLHATCFVVQHSSNPLNSLQLNMHLSIT